MDGPLSARSLPEATFFFNFEWNMFVVVNIYLALTFYKESAISCY